MSITAEEIEDLIYCSRIGEVEAIKGFFEECAKNDDSIKEPMDLLVQIKDNVTNSTALHMASANGHSKVTHFFLEIIKNASSEQNKALAKEYINAQNDSGNTALHWAALNGHLEIVKELCETGLSDPFLKNKAGYDVFYEADNAEQEPVIDYLLAKYNIDLTGDEPENPEDSSSRPEEPKQEEKEDLEMAEAEA